MGIVIEGKPVAEKISEELIKEAQELKKQNIIPKLVIIRVGARPDDISYEKGALARCSRIGIDMEVRELPEKIEQNDLIAEIKKANEDKSVNGVLIFRPLPKHLSEDIIKYEISPEKDVDCFNPFNAAKILEGDKTGFAPCTPTAVIEMLKFYNVTLEGKKAVVLGRSMVVGKPVSLLLLNENATVIICHSKTKDIEKIAKNADILIAAIGKPKMVDESYIGEGAVVVDVGINLDGEGNLCGDVDFDSCKEKVSMITPVPKGVGSVTTTILAKHVIKACKWQHNIL